MNIVGKYDDSSVELEGTAEALHELSQVIRELVEAKDLSLALPSTSPTPYLGYLESVRIEQGTGKVCISRTGNQVLISGSPEMLTILSHNIESMPELQRRPASGMDRDHVHIEYYPGHFYLKEESVPLVFTKCASSVGTTHESVRKPPSNAL